MKFIEWWPIKRKSASLFSAYGAFDCRKIRLIWCSRSGGRIERQKPFFNKLTMALSDQESALGFDSSKFEALPPSVSQTAMRIGRSFVRQDRDYCPSTWTIGSDRWLPLVTNNALQANELTDFRVLFHFWAALISWSPFNLQPLEICFTIGIPGSFGQQLANVPRESLARRSGDARDTLGIRSRDTRETFILKFWERIQTFSKKAPSWPLVCPISVHYLAESGIPTSNR